MPNCHGSQAAIGLHSGLRCGGPHGLLMTCSEKSDMRLFSLSGKLLAVVEPSGLQVRTAALHCLQLELACLGSQDLGAAMCSCQVMALGCWATQDPLQCRQQVQLAHSLGTS